jgi:hypothetical protein
MWSSPKSGQSAHFTANDQQGRFIPSGQQGLNAEKRWK